MAKADSEAKSAANDQNLHELTDIILQAANGNAPDMSTSIETALGQLIEGTREKVAEKQQVHKRLFAAEDIALPSPQSTSTSPLSSRPSSFSPSASSPPSSSGAHKIPRRFFGWKDTNIL